VSTVEKQYLVFIEYVIILLKYILLMRLNVRSFEKEDKTNL